MNFDALSDPSGPNRVSVDGLDLYPGMIPNGFSEQALGLVFEIQDWSLLRWVMANHLADVAEGIANLKDGERRFYFHGLYGKIERDPAGDSPGGFDATQSGVSLGFDRKTSERRAWGLYAGYTDNDIDFTHVSTMAGDWENQKTWHVGGYILSRIGNWILSDTLTYRISNHETFRDQLDGAATADFDSWSLANDFRAGWIAKEIGEGSHWQIVPEIGLNFGYLKRDGYTEKNGFSHYNYETTVWESVLGIRFRGRFDRRDGSRWVPQLRLSWVHLLSGGEVCIGQKWNGKWGAYTEALDDNAIVVDLGLSLYTAGNTEISLNYNGRFSDTSDSHGAWIRIMKKF